MNIERSDKPFIQSLIEVIFPASIGILGGTLLAAAIGTPWSLSIVAVIIVTAVLAGMVDLELGDPNT